MINGAWRHCGVRELVAGRSARAPYSSATLDRRVLPVV